jgi:hypothetical protein
LIFKSQEIKSDRGYFLAILLLIKTIDSNIATMNIGRITHDGNSGTVGIGEGIVLVEELDVGVGVAIGNGFEVGAEVGAAVGTGVGVDVGVAVGVGVGVYVGVGVGVAVGVGDGVGVG